MAGIDRCGKPAPDQTARIVNQGEITIADRGLAALVAPGVDNAGAITARLGRVELAGSRTFTLDFNGDGLMSFDTGVPVSEAAVAPAEAAALVTNSGTIASAGGTVRRTAHAVAGEVERARELAGVTSGRAGGGEGRRG